MPTLKRSEVTKFVQTNIWPLFHEKRIHSLQELQLKEILKRKNPYLYRAKNTLTAEQIIKSFLEAHLSSQEETIFGGFLEDLAIFVCKKVFNGEKSSAEGIDLEFNRDGIRYLVTIKSGPNWGNSSQVNKMKEDFRTAFRRIRQRDRNAHIIAVNGCCYGKIKNPNKKEYYKYCGQQFWELISGNDNLYKDIIEPMGHKAKQRNEEFNIEYAAIVNRFSKDFIDMFCNEYGSINWKKLIEFNSGKYPDLKPIRRSK